MGLSKSVHSVDDFSSLIQKSDLAKRFHISKLGIFGSFARGEKSNDIDLLIEGSISLDEALDLKLELERLTGTQIDIVLSQYANPIVLHRAKKDLRYVEINS